MKLLKNIKKKSLDYKTLYELIETHIRPQRTPLINMMMKPVLAPYEKTDLLKEQLSWLIKKRNKISELNFDLKHSEGTFHVDISNNKELRNIFFLRILPIYELNISQTAIGDTKLLSEMDLNVLHIDSTPINNLRFVYLMQNLVQLHISQGSFPKNILNRLPDEIEIVEK